MNIIIGKNSGFCNGVKYTVDEAIKALVKYKKVYCLGQIVHNERVIKDLEEKGMISINTIDECPNNSKLIIRAHVELKKVYDIAKEKQIEIIDLTCGKIKVIRNKISKKINDYYIVIIGKKNHPETLGVKSFSGNNCSIIENEDDLEALYKDIKKSKLKKVYMVSQTTFNDEKFEYLTKIISEKINKDINIDKTICNATYNRQQETDNISKKVNIMIIIGGKNSSNTKELEVISKKNCERVYLLQDTKELSKININKDTTVGIMAGASTPENVINEFLDYLNNLNI